MSKPYIDFKSWWDEVGSALRNNSNEDYEEFAFRISLTAWLAGSGNEREECAKIADKLSNHYSTEVHAHNCATLIRQRGLSK